MKRTAAAWVLRQAARHAYEASARRRPDWSNPGPTGTGTGGGWANAGTTGSAYRPAGERPADERPSSAYSAGPRPTSLTDRFEEVVRRAWPLLDTPANRERAARFVQRMRTVANSPR